MMMVEVIRQAIMDALQREKWTVLDGRSPIGFEQPWVNVHAMLTGGVVCWWRVFPAPAGGNTIIQVILEDHRVTVERHIELSDALTARMRYVPQAIRSAVTQLEETEFWYAMMGGEVERRYNAAVQQITADYTPVLSPEFRRMLREARDAATEAHRDIRWQLANPPGQKVRW